ncbi:hypothetical protein N7G274_000340 [Stereocaulon virgatum]|uniref:Uncharacterized protein n=1 Tax=Stereocaulon virgatum TaxID=373712 RepID=A0ABR4ASC2_9LECA
MQIASILSDLTSLRVCDHSAALALVSVHKSDAKSSTIGSDPDNALKSVSKAEDDVDMQRATDLVELHYGVKMSHMEGEDAGLRQARRDVDRVLETLDRRQAKGSKTRG